MVMTLLTGRKTAPFWILHFRFWITKRRSSRNLKSKIKNLKSTSYQWGFTLIELLVVLAIIAMIVGMGTPAFLRFNAGLRFKATARQLAEMLQVARSQAITMRTTCSVLFDLDHRRVTVTDDAKGETLHTPLELPESIKLAQPGQPDGSGIGFDERKATFLPTGGLKGRTGTLWLSDVAGASQKITVYGSTGRVVLE